MDLEEFEKSLDQKVRKLKYEIREEYDAVRTNVEEEMKEKVTVGPKTMARYKWLLFIAGTMGVVWLVAKLFIYQ